MLEHLYNNVMTNSLSIDISASISNDEVVFILSMVHSTIVGFLSSEWMLKEGGHSTSCLTRLLFLHLQVCRPQKQPKAHSARPQNVHENQVPPLPLAFQRRTTFDRLSAKSLTLVFVSSLGLGERGHTRETTTDRRERREWRRGPRDAQAEEPSALLSLPNQIRAGAAGTGILSLWSVSSLRRMSLYKLRWSLAYGIFVKCLHINNVGKL